MAEPTKIKIPWARDDGSKTAIPETSQIGIVDGRASFPDGFVPLNGTPKAAGGIPPFKSDMNGILYAITNVLKWVCSGGLFKRDASFQTAISGYPVGAVLLKADNSGIWFNTVDGNTSDPDTGGAGWQHIDPRLYAVASGSTTAYTATFDPAIAVLVDGMRVVINTSSVGTNTTTTPTFSPNGLTARTIKRQNGAALKLGDLPQRATLEYDLTNTCWVLLNPLKSASGLAESSITTVTATTVHTNSIAGGLVVVNAAGATTQTLPAANTLDAGQIIQFLNINTGAAAVTRAGADTITVNNTTVTSLSLGNGDTLTLVSNGSNGWYAIDGTVNQKYANSYGYIQNASYYSQHLPTGFIIQCGQGVTNSSGLVTVTFPEAFPNQLVRLLTDNAGSGAGLYIPTLLASSSTTGFSKNMSISSTGASAPAGVVMGYIAIGY